MAESVSRARPATCAGARRTAASKPRSPATVGKAQASTCSTTNGGIELRVPDNYSARLETRTVNGAVDIGFPVMAQGRIGREISTTLGSGGSLVRAATTNGQVRVSRR